jgi:hypothetical protein
VKGKDRSNNMHHQIKAHFYGGFGIASDSRMYKTKPFHIDQISIYRGTISNSSGGGLNHRFVYILYPRINAK